MVDDLFVGLVVRELGLVAGEEFAMMLDFWGRAELFPIGLNGADAVGADGDDFLDLCVCVRFRDWLSASCWKTRSLPRRRAGSPVHFSLRRTP